MADPQAGRAAGVFHLEGKARSLSPGALIANTYRVEAQIASGGMGAVYRCRHEVMGDLCAVKVVLEEHLGDERAVALFLREAMALKAVNHPAVVRYETTLRDEDGNLFLVMEYIDGKPLSHFLKQGRLLSPKSVIDFGARLAEGLRAAHAAGVVHRDMSPDNILIPNEEIYQAKIIDFGIAKDTTGADHTIIGDNFAGRVRYASPEQLGLFGRQVDERTDVYSLGLVMAQAGGVSLEVATTDMADAIRLRSVDAEIPASVDPELRLRLQSMLRADPAERDRDIVRAWTAGGAQHTPSDAAPSMTNASVTDDGFSESASETTGAQTRWRRPKRSAGSRIALAASILLAVGLIGVGGWFTYQTMNPPASTEEVRRATAAIQKEDDPIVAADKLLASGVADDMNAALRIYMKSYSDGDARGALAIGKLYDPQFYSPQSSPMSKADAGKAKLWYGRAAELGNAEAKRLLPQVGG